MAIVEAVGTSIETVFVPFRWDNEARDLLFGVFVLSAIARPVVLRRRSIQTIFALLVTVSALAAAYATYLVATGDGFNSIQGQIWFSVAGVPVAFVTAWALSRLRSPA